MQKEPGDMERFDLIVPSIHCEGCVQVIGDALGRIPQVVHVDGKPKEKQVTVAVRKGSLSRERITEEISRLGHVVES